MTRLLVLACTTVLLLSACGKKEVEVVDNTPPPPTPQEIANSIKQSAQISGALPPSGTRLPKQQADSMAATIQREKTKHSATADGKQALRLVTRDLEKKITDAERAALWEHVLAYIGAHSILEPESSRFLSLQDRARAELSRPQPSIRGFIQDGHGETIVMLNMYMPLSGETTKEQMRVGEELAGLILSNIIGNNNGVTFEYRETGDTFEVYTNPE